MTRPEDSVPPDVTGRTAAGGETPAIGTARVSPAGPVPAQRRPEATVYGSARPLPPGAGPAPRRGRALLAVLIPAVLLLALLGSGAAVQLNRSLPVAALTTSIASTLRIPGKAATLPWPSQGSAELMVEGLGRLGGSGATKAAPIGSVAKVMTAYLILKNHPLRGAEEGPGIEVTAADVADYRARIASNQSLVPVRVGTTLTQRDGLEALMLPSANNVAHLLAVWDAGSEDAFTAKMNAAATELGMTDTHYSDPSGYLPSTVSTAADQVLLGRAALKLPLFATIAGLRSATIPVAGTIRNYNDLLGELGVFGIKTGSTTQAGGNLLFAARLTAGRRTLTVVGAVFNQPGPHTPQQLARVNTEVRRLLKAVRGTVKEYTLLAARPVGEVTTAWGAKVTVSTAAPLRVVGWPGLAVPVRVTTTAPRAEVTRGQVVGAVQASGVRVELSADQRTPEPRLWWKLTRR